MATVDDLGQNSTRATASSKAHYEKALHQLQCFIGDPVASIDEALALSPGFVMAHAVRRICTCLAPSRAHSRSRGNAAKPPPGWRATRANAVTSRRSANLPRVAGTKPPGRSRTCRSSIRASVGVAGRHQIDSSPATRACCATGSRGPAGLDASMPGYHAVLGMHAFGLEETGDYGRAEARPQGVELEPRDGWAQHAVAHVMEMQCRQRDGIAWMRANPDAWTKDSSSASITGGIWRSTISISARRTRCWRCSTARSSAAARRVALDMVDAAALLWRLHLRGIDVGDRWNAVADNWQPSLRPAIRLQRRARDDGLRRRRQERRSETLLHRRIGRWRARMTMRPSPVRSAISVGTSHSGVWPGRLRTTVRLLRSIPQLCPSVRRQPRAARRHRFDADRGGVPVGRDNACRRACRRTDRREAGQPSRTPVCPAGRSGSETCLTDPNRRLSFTTRRACRR